MATIVNNPTPTTDNGNSIGTIMGVIAILILLAVLLFYGLPAYRQSTGGGSDTTNNNAPTYEAPAAPEQPSTQNMPDVNIPDKIDVNVNPNNGGEQNPNTDNGNQ